MGESYGRIIRVFEIPGRANHATSTDRPVRVLAVSLAVTEMTELAVWSTDTSETNLFNTCRLLLY